MNSVTRHTSTPFIEYQSSPKIYLAKFPGRWLLAHCKASWRSKDPDRGFQRIVKEKRARSIAAEVLDKGRVFPNAIVLATDVDEFPSDESGLQISDDTTFLVVDGQHRLWAQKFSEEESTYSAIVHMGLTEVEMARLFLEINDKQKRVPASLRWDLYRLVYPDEEQSLRWTSEIVLYLASTKGTALYQKIDLTGEQSKNVLKQASIAPEIRDLISSSKFGLDKLDLETLEEVFERYLAAIRSINADAWNAGESPFYGARTLRAMLRLLGDVVSKEDSAPESLSTKDFAKYVEKINPKSLASDLIKAQQGAAGIKAIYETIRAQALH
jgi:DGQHR domain-containing protein